MSLEIIYGDITKMDTEAIVNAANKTLWGGKGIDGAIHKAAGKRLLLECLTLGGCKTGQAKITAAYRLPCKYIIHTVGPKYKKGNTQQEEQLYNCYYNSLTLAYTHGIKSIAFPLISAGIYGYPADEVLKIAEKAIAAFLKEHEMQVYLVKFVK